MTLRSFSLRSRSIVLLASALAAGVLLPVACGGDDGDSGDDGTLSGGSSGTGASNGSGGFGFGASGPGTGSQGGQGQGGESQCGGTSVEAEAVKANLLFVIDRSKSMDDEIDAGEKKWPAMVASLKGALDAAAPELSVGLQFFPGTDAVEGCGMPASSSDLTVPVGPLADTAAQIKTALDDAMPFGNTPTADAIELAYDYFVTGDGKDLEGEKYVLLALDGGPNCNSGFDSCGQAECTTNIEGKCPNGAGNCCESVGTACLDDTRTIDKVTQLADAGIQTFVIGIPGSDAGTYINVLDQLAVEGGHPASQTSPKYFKADDETNLAETMASLTKELIKSCDRQLKAEPPDREKVNVYIDGEVLPQAGDDGWEYDDSTTPTCIHIMVESCTMLETTGAESVSVKVGCPTVIIK